MKLVTSKILKIFGWIIAVLLVIWGGVWGYVIMNKKSIISEVTTLINEKIRGDIKIGDLEPSLISTFPHVSIRLSEVVVRDTMWTQHHHDLVNAKDIYVRLAFLSLFSGNPQITKVIVENGNFYLYNDSTGYSNDYIFKGKNKKGAARGEKLTSYLPDVELKKVRLTADLQDRNKLYDFDIAKLKCNMKNDDDIITMKVKTDILVHSLAFNKKNGSFVKEKQIEGDFEISLTRQSRILYFNKIALNIDDQPFRLSGAFNFSSPPPLYKLVIEAKNIDYRKTATLVSQNIKGKLDSFNIEKPITVIAVIDGSKRPNKNPLIDLFATVKNNELTTPIGKFSNASFTTHFTNQILKEERRMDKNSGFLFKSFTGTWEGIHLQSDSINVSNLEHPLLQTDLRAQLKMKELNDLLGSNSIEFTKGSADINLRYRGLMIPGDSGGVSVTGAMNFKDATILYIPRNISLTNCSGKLVFDDQDVYVRQLKARTGKTQLVMNGGIKSLFSLIERNPDKILLNWNIASSNLDMADFTSFLQKRSTRKSEIPASRRFMKIANNIDRMMNDCSVALQLNADRLVYKKFEASDVAASVQLTNTVIAIKDVLIHHAGGTMQLNCSLREVDNYNSLTLNTAMNNVNVEKVFTSFNNFGQDGITDKNIRGMLTSRINITGAITDKAEVLSNSLKGTIDISLKNGRLIDFEPIQKISEKAFKNRDFSDIRFAELKDRLVVTGSQIKVNRMEISSTVLTMFVEGIYDIKRGTDLSIQVPLSNLKKKEDSLLPENKGVESKNGVSLRLRAKTGEDGKAKISWDPFKLALKNKDKAPTDTTDLLKDIKEAKAASDSTTTVKKKIDKLPADTSTVPKSDTTRKRNIP